jgi:hypothetical protein
MAWVVQALGQGYAGVSGAVLAMLVFAGQFARRRWPGLLVGFGIALGVAVAQAITLTGHAGGSGAFDLAVNGAIGGVVGMLCGGLAADWWQARLAGR